MGKALIVGNADINQNVSHVLRQAGFETTLIDYDHLGWPGLDRLQEEGPDLLIIGEDSIVANGVEILPALRRITTASIIVTGNGEEEGIITALIHGADAYLSHSASDEMLLAHVGALMRRQPLTSAAI
ncbi:MAG: response regulator transcription factor [Chloroflexi bacterium]|nr:response regulator transcription factor [Chloroflexota bacterium]